MTSVVDAAGNHGRHHPSSAHPVIPRTRGVALLMVLIIVLAITVIATGFVARADVELACGRNMLLRAQMDHLADSALEHAQGLLLHPHEVSGVYWAGSDGLQLVEGSSDYLRRRSPFAIRRTTAITALRARPIG